MISACCDNFCSLERTSYLVLFFRIRKTFVPNASLPKTLGCSTHVKMGKLVCLEFYLDKFIEVSRRELTWECDYEREAKFSEEFRSVDFFISLDNKVNGGVFNDLLVKCLLNAMA